MRGMRIMRRRGIIRTMRKNNKKKNSEDRRGTVSTFQKLLY